jgi:hypothetical protein
MRAAFALSFRVSLSFTVRIANVTAKPFVASLIATGLVRYANRSRRRKRGGVALSHSGGAPAPIASVRSTRRASRRGNQANIPLVGSEGQAPVTADYTSASRMGQLWSYVATLKNGEFRMFMFFHALMLALGLGGGFSNYPSYGFDAGSVQVAAPEGAFASNPPPTDGGGSAPGGR